MNRVITAIYVPCPLPNCTHVQEFSNPPRLRSMVCGGCGYYVCESEWHAAFMARVKATVADTVSRVQEAGAR